MVEGAGLLAAMISGFLAAGYWKEEPASNVLDTGAPWYDVYETKDGKYVSIGSIEERFYAELIEKLGLNAGELPGQHDRSRWPELRSIFERTFRIRTREEWCKVFDGSDACFAPVLSWTEARRDAHNAARGTYIEVGGVEQPAPAPRFSRTPAQVRGTPPERGEGGGQALADWKFDEAGIENLKALGISFSA
jgi:alpha-methylacyl-CoA racemase